MKIAWCLLFALSLVVYAAIFFGAASGASNKPFVMMQAGIAVAIGLLCGLLTIVGLFAGQKASGFMIVLPIVALWPLVWVGVFVALSIFK